jgi:DNA polymerase-3 subunit delta
MKDKPAKKSQISTGLFLFYGDDFLIKERVSNLIDSILDPASKITNLKTFDGSSLDMGDLIAYLMNRPLFWGIRVALVEQTPLFISQANITKTIGRIVDLWKAGDSKAAFRFLKQLAVSLDLVPLTGDLPNDWLKEVDEVSRLDPSDRELLLQAAATFANDFSGSISSGDENILLDILQYGLPQDAYLIMTANSVDKRNPLLKAFQEKGQVEELRPRFDRSFVRLDRTYFQSLVKDFLRTHGKTITSEAMELAFSKSGKDIRRIRSELQKIVSYLGKRSEITVHDVKDLFLDFHEAAFFDLSRAIRDSNPEKLLIALHENLKAVDHPLQTLAVMASEFRKLIAARELLFTSFKSTWKSNLTYDGFVSIVAKVRRETSSEKLNKGKFNLLNQKDFPLFQLLKTAQAFPLDKLIRVMEMILDADMQIKSSKLGSFAPEIILENLVLTICDSDNHGRKISVKQ